jgi:hypothetical protein
MTGPDSCNAPATDDTHSGTAWEEAELAQSDREYSAAAAGVAACIQSRSAA